MSEDVDQEGFASEEAEFDRRPGRLIQARQLWAFLLRSGTPCDSRRWCSWADARIRDEVTVAPAWLFALSIATTREEAIKAIEEDVGLDVAKYRGQVFERDALTIGFVFARHLDGELSREEMWAELRRIVDVAAFIDDGHWRRWQGINGEDPEDPLAANAGWIRHLAWLAVRSENQLLRDADEPRPEPSWGA